MTLRIVIVDCDHGYIEPEEEAAKEVGVDLVMRPCSRPEEVVEAAADADAVVNQRLPLPADVLSQLPRCRVIARYGSGTDGIDAAAARSLGMKVVYTPEFCYPEVADHTLALILDLARQTTALDRLSRDDPARLGAEYGRRLGVMRNVHRMSTRCLGIVGFGKIGRAVATRAKAFGMRVVVHDPFASSSDLAAAGVEAADLDAVMAAADFLTLHVPLTPDSRGLIDERRLSLMKPSAYLVNASRAGVVDQGALIAALQTGRLAGAALDVTDPEPLPPGHPLLDLTNVILTPHVAFYSQTSILNVKRDVVLYAARALSGRGSYFEFDPSAPFRPVFVPG